MKKGRISVLIRHIAGFLDNWLHYRLKYEYTKLSILLRIINLKLFQRRFVLHCRMSYNLVQSIFFGEVYSKGSVVSELQSSVLLAWTKTEN
jgi:hypothetical protein